MWHAISQLFAKLRYIDDIFTCTHGEVEVKKFMEELLSNLRVIEKRFAFLDHNVNVE